jgi:hypothetical protein
MANSDRVVNGGVTMSCAVCRTETHWEMRSTVPSGWHHSKCLQRAIDDTPRQCEHNGCEFTGTRSEVAEHTRDCEWRPREAPVLITLVPPTEDTDRVQFATTAIPRLRRVRRGEVMNVRFRGIARTWRGSAGFDGRRPPHRVCMVCPGLAHEMHVRRLRQPRTERPAPVPDWHCVWNGPTGSWSWIHARTNEVRTERPEADS